MPSAAGMGREGAMGATWDELRRILGEVEDAKTLEILKLEPTTAELEQAAYWADGEGDQLAREGAPLSGRAAKIYEILVRDEDEAESQAR